MALRAGAFRVVMQAQGASPCQQLWSSSILKARKRVSHHGHVRALHGGLQDVAVRPTLGVHGLHVRGIDRVGGLDRLDHEL